MKLSQAWEMYKSDKQLEGYSPFTMKGYELQHKLFSRYVGEIEIDNVTDKLIKDYLAKDFYRLKSSSIAFRMKYFKSLFRWMTDEGYVRENPARKLRPPKNGKRIPKSMDEETIENLNISCKTELEHTLNLLLYDTGCRVGEVYRMKKTDINWNNRSVIVLGKGSKEREVYFSIQCKIWMQKYIDSRDDNNPYLFVTERKYQNNNNQPRRMSTDQLRWVVKRVAKNANVENVYPHRFRHSKATSLYSKGAELELIRSYLGHESVDTTKIYADMTGERRRELINKYA